MKKCTFPLMAAAAAAVLPLLLPQKALPAFGRWLRALSLSSPAGNTAAWAVVLILTALPALGLLWRPGCKWDLLLLAAAGEIFAGLYLLVNPTAVYAFPVLDGRQFISIAAAGCVSATLLAWAVLRWLRDAEHHTDTGRTLEKLLGFAAVMLGWLAAWNTGLTAWQNIQNVASANTMPGVSLAGTNIFIILLAAANLIPTLLGCGALLLAGRLAGAMEADPFGENTIAMAEKLSRDCGKIAAASVLICAGGNLLQFIWMPYLHSVHFTVSFPVFTVLLAVTLDLLCRYFRRAKAVSDDNDTII